MMFRALRRLFASKPIKPWFAERATDAEEVSKDYLSVRRWDAAKTTRLNSMHWSGVTGATINADLNAYLETLRTRAEFEASQNPDVNGVIETHINDVVGENGPSLQVQSDNEAYNAALEEVWGDWWRMPDVNGQLSGVDLLRVDCRLLWTNGEWLNQIIIDQDVATPIKTRLLAIAPRRLKTPTSKGAEPLRYMGVLRNERGRPLSYWITNPLDVDFALGNPDDGDDIPASDIDHGFFILEPGQVRGVPLLATGLQAIGDLRDYDAEVLEAARQAANQGVLLQTMHPDANYVEVNETAEIERGSMATLPPGWTMAQITPQQPSTQYNDYRDEHLRKVGRPACMPLMMIQLDASGHNYSSARFDSKGYERAVRNAFRAFFVRRSLNRFVDIIAREAKLLPGLLPKRPENVKYVWRWDGFAQADPGKEEQARTERLSNGTSTYRDECADVGKDWQDVFTQRELEARELEKRKLPTPGTDYKEATLYVGPPKAKNGDDEGGDNE
jgi:lambda family phage portal protein